MPGRSIDHESLFNRVIPCPSHVGQVDLELVIEARRPAKDQMVAIRIGIVLNPVAGVARGATVKEPICTAPSVQAVKPVSAVQEIVTVPSEENIGHGATVQGILPCIPDKRIRPEPASDFVVTVATVQRVVSSTAVNRVIAGTAIDHIEQIIICVASDKGIIPVPSAQRVAARAAIQRVVPHIAAQGVVPTKPVDLIRPPPFQATGCYPRPRR